MMKISQAAKALNVSRDSLRNWDFQGILTPAHVSPGGHRYYSEEQLANFSFPADYNKPRKPAYYHQLQKIIELLHALVEPFEERKTT